MQQLKENRPEVPHIPEENKQGGKDQSCTDIEYDQTDDRVNEHYHFPSKSNIVNKTENKEHNKNQKKIDEVLSVFSEKKKIFGNIYFRIDTGIFYQRGHAFTCGFAEITVNDRTAKEVNGVMVGCPAEKVCENKPHDEQLQQRVQYTPNHSQRCSCIAFFEVPFDELLEQKLVFFHFKYIGVDFLSNHL